MASDDPLKDPTGIRATSIVNLVSQGSRVIESATSEDKALIWDAIDQVYVVDPDRTAELTFQELQDLQHFYRYLRADNRNRGSIVATWLDRSDGIDRLAMVQQVWLLNQFETPASANVTVSALKTSVLQYLISDADRMTTRQLSSYVRALAPHLSESEKSTLLPALGQQWATRIAGKSPFNLTDAREVSAIRAWQDIFELLGDFGAQQSQYIDHLPNYLARMTATELYWRFRYEYVELLAQPIRTKAAQDHLFARAQAEGSLRQDILQILSSSYRQTDQSDAWNQHLDKMIADTGLTDDQRAQWMIAKAYCLALTGDKDRYIPRRGLSLLHDAMEIAQTDQTRLSCLQQIVEINSDHFWFDMAREAITKYRPYFVSENIDAINAMKDRIAMVEHIARQIIRTKSRDWQHR